MNLLITNIQEDQAYLVLRCLEPETRRIVVTLSGDSFFRRWLGMSAWSRFVDKRYRVPDCTADWRAGIIGTENTPGEERYIQRIEEICEREGIDVIFPSYDAEVYVFAKNKRRLAARGVMTVAADIDCLLRVLDKSVTLRAGEKVGFPIPRTRVPENREQLLQAAREFGPPWVLKPRCNAHGANIRLARDIKELEATFSELEAIQPRPLLQEYLPAQTKRNYYLLVNPQLEVVSMVSPKVLRYRRGGMRTPCAAAESTAGTPCGEQVRALVRELGIWGVLTVQTIVDARDGTPRLMEINPRFGHNLWYRTVLGLNEPSMLLRLLQGKEPGPQPPLPEGVLCLDPLWDLLHLAGQALDQSLAWLRSKFGNRVNAAIPYRKEALGPLLREFRSEYFGRSRRITCPLNRGFLSDPLPPLVRITRVFIEAIQRRAS